MVRNSDKCVPLPPFIELRFFLFFFYSCDLFLGSDGDYLESRSTFYDTSEAGACQRFCRPSGMVSRWEVLTDEDDSRCQSVGFRGKRKIPLTAGPGLLDLIGFATNSREYVNGRLIAVITFNRLHGCRIVKALSLSRE